MKAAYSSYKPTSILWLPVIPEHWELVKSKYLFKERIQKGFENEPLLAATQSQGVIPKTLYETNTVTAQKDFHLLKLVNVGDFVISLRSFQGGIEYAYYRGIISPAYSVFFSKDETKINKQYFRYFFKAQPFINSLKLYVTGIREGQNIDYSEFKDSLFPLPKEDEQTAIANYLDTKTEEINRFISKKQKLIELLKEQKQAIIDKAVIYGIDKEVKLKGTGIEFIDQIPSHWSLRKLGTIGRFSKGGNISRSELIEENNGIPAILYGDIYTKYEIEATVIKNRISEETAINSVPLKKGDLLFAGSGETKEDIGKCVVYNSNDICYAGGDIIIFKQTIFDSYFISYSQNSSIAKHQKAISSKGEIIVHTYGSKLRNIIMPFPPTIEEQQEIVTLIKRESNKIDTAISRIEKEIELIKEYKQSLIAEVVTGKIKVVND